MSNDLVEPDDLDRFTGGPFEEDIIDAAVDWLRNEAGWHIAPVVDETLVLDSDGGRVLLLPTLRIDSIEKIRDITDEDSAHELSGWRVSRHKGMVSRHGGWPRGFETVEVTLEHGFEECPPSLLPLIAERCQFQALNPTIGQEATGSESVSYRRDRSSEQVDQRLRPYMVRWGP